MACLVPACLLAWTTSAVADGDPASDVLLIESVFYPYSVAVSPALTTALNTTVSRAHAAGFPIKVALIATPVDLGAIPQLFGKPEAYAKYLDYEISYNSVVRLLVVMPQGFGTFASGPVSALAGIRIDAAAKSDGLAAAAITAIQTLAKLDRHPIAIPSLPGGSRAGGTGGSGAPVALIVALVVVLLAASGGGLVYRQRRAALPNARDKTSDSSR